VVQEVALLLQGVTAFILLTYPLSSCHVTPRDMSLLKSKVSDTFWSNVLMHLGGYSTTFARFLVPHEFVQKTKRRSISLLLYGSDIQMPLLQ
jgi:hypothetical protein